MTHDDRPGFRAAMVGMSETFTAPISEARLELYWWALEDMTWEGVSRAFNAWLKEGQRFPVPAQLRELVTGTTEDRAASAWAALFEAAKRIDAYRSLFVEDGAIAFAFDATFKTWPAFCGLDLSPEMWAAKRKEFTALYRAGVQRECGPRLLIGHFDATRAQTGLGEGNEPGYIGPDHRVAGRAPILRELGEGDDNSS